MEIVDLDVRAKVRISKKSFPKFAGETGEIQVRTLVRTEDKRNLTEVLVDPVIEPDGRAYQTAVPLLRHLC